MVNSCTVSTKLSASRHVGVMTSVCVNTDGDGWWVRDYSLHGEWLLTARQTATDPGVVYTFYSKSGRAVTAVCINDY